MKRWIQGLVLAVAIMIGAPSASAVTYETAPSFCGSAILRDYLAPLKRMPKLQSRGRMNFGSSSLVLNTSRPLIVGGGNIEAWFSLRDSGPAVHPNWILTATLTSVNRHGHSVKAIRSSRKRIRAISRSTLPGIEIQVDDTPAFYRLTIGIQGDAGQKLGDFGYYFRVVPPVHDTRLGLNSGSYRPEQTVFARVENFGTEHIHYGADYRISRLEGTRWVKAPESPGRFIKPLYGTPPGAIGKCFQFWVPPAMPPGRYRMTKSIHWLDPINAEFDVVP
jgi:hypothetical protein